MTNQSVVWAWARGDGDEAGPLVAKGVLGARDLVFFLEFTGSKPSDGALLRLLISSQGTVEPAFAQFGLEELDFHIYCGRLFTLADPRPDLLLEPAPSGADQANQMLKTYLNEAREGFDPDVPVPPAPTGPFPPLPDWPPLQPGWPRWVCYAKPSWC